MKVKSLKLFSLLVAFLLIICTFVGCGAGSKADNMIENEEYAAENGFVEDSISNTSSNKVPDNRKIIENIDLSVQTKQFDTLVDTINSKINELDGYTESCSIYGREYDSSDNRTANMTIRIPADKSSKFTDFIGKNSVIVHKTISTEDVTLTYVDMESRVGVLEAEKESLEGLLKKAKTMTDIIAIREKLTDVISSIESYKSQLRTYDNLVNYCTITIDIREVERTAVVEKQNIWQKIGTNLKNNFVIVWDIILNVFVFLISTIPYFIPLGVIAIIVLVIIKLVHSKNKKRNNQQNNN